MSSEGLQALNSLVGILIVLKMYVEQVFVEELLLLFELCLKLYVENGLIISWKFVLEVCACEQWRPPSRRGSKGTLVNCLLGVLIC